MYFVYILASGRHGTLYIGVILFRRGASSISAVKARYLHSLLARKYNVRKLVYVERFDRVGEAIGREKPLKRWKYDWKIELIERDNLEWRDLSDLIV